VPDEYAEIVEEPLPAAPEIRDLSREQAIEYGRRLGENEADRRGETGAIREERIQRAMSYAAWDFDGRPSRQEVRVERWQPDFKK